MCGPRSRRGVISGRGGTVLCLNSVRVVMRGRWSLTGNDIALRRTVMIQVVIYLSCFVLRSKLLYILAALFYDPSCLYILATLFYDPSCYVTYVPLCFLTSNRNFNNKLCSRYGI
jgi:hypothetical protein